jgi:hypothetical protein
VRWKALPASRAVPPAKTSVKEIEGLRQLVSRDLADAGLIALSADRRFATAYNAVLRLSKKAVACAGYRVTSGAGQHQIEMDEGRISRVRWLIDTMPKGFPHPKRRNA